MKYNATIVTANIRDVDGCDSDSAVNAIMIAVADAADRWAEAHDIVLEIDEHVPRHDRQGYTVRVSWEADEPVLYDDMADINETCNEIAEYLDDAISEAIQAGAWEEENAA